MGIVHDNNGHDNNSFPGSAWQRNETEALPRRMPSRREPAMQYDSRQSLGTSTNEHLN